MQPFYILCVYYIHSETKQKLKTIIMKKLSALLIVLIATTSLFAQQRRTKSFMGWHLTKDTQFELKENEVKLNLATTIFGLYPEISYERILHEDFSVGGSAGIGLNGDYPLDFSITPYARWFFGGTSTNLQKYGAGFFIEANGSVFSHNDYDYELSNDVGAGLGLALGWKYISKNNWVGEIFGGAGRDFVSSYAYPRIGISIGKRF